MIKKKFAILVSGYGRGAIQIIKDCRNGLIKPQLSLLVSSNPNSESLKYASSNNIPYAVIEKDKFETKSEFETEIKSLLFNHGIDYVFLAGWMPIIGPHYCGISKELLITSIIITKFQRAKRY